MTEEECEGTLSCGCPVCHEMHMEDERWVDIARER